MKLTFKVEGAELVRQGLQNVRDEVPKVGRQGLRTIMERIKRKMQEYPPEPRGQSKVSFHSVLGKTFSPVKGRYVRTGNLGSHWAIIQNDNGYSIENTATRKGKAYPRYVVGGADGSGQAWMHKGRWQVFRDVVDKEMEALPEEISSLIQTIARRYQ